jgi:excinuclease ABC subunit C
MNEPILDQKLQQQIANLPTDPGVYLFKDAKGQVIYVGKAKELRTRVRTYFREGADGRYHIQFLVRRVIDIDFIATGTEQEALLLENNLIKKHRPRYNIFLKDDKTYVSVRLNVDHPFPRLTIVRKPRKDKAKYFGPYASAGSVRATLRTLGRVFPMRTCSDQELTQRKRPCLYYYIKRCPAPCVDLADPQQYRDTVSKVTMFLKGRGQELVKTLSDRMDLQAAERQYEAAARTRDQLYAVQRVLERQRMSATREAERDVFGVYRSKEKLVIQSLYVRAGKVMGGISTIKAAPSYPERLWCPSMSKKRGHWRSILPRAARHPSVSFVRSGATRKTSSIWRRKTRGSRSKARVPSVATRSSSKNCKTCSSSRRFRSASSVSTYRTFRGMRRLPRKPRLSTPNLRRHCTVATGYAR